jgi:orotate phosphoribosyltransferase
MKPYQRDLALLLAQSQALFFKDDLTLKDGRPTPYFVNFGLFRTGRLISELGRIMADYLVDLGLHQAFDVLVGPSYKGSALAVATAGALWHGHQADRGFDYDRKEAKTHGEASHQEARFVTGALYDNCRVLIIDDVVTTMATKFDLLRRLTEEATARSQSYHPAGVVLYLDREQTTAVYDPRKQVMPGERGQDAVKNFKMVTGLPVGTILGIRETLDFLHRERIPVSQNGKAEPLSEGTMETFRRYHEIYGIIE